MSAQFEWDNGYVNRNFHILRHLQRQKRIGKIFSIDFVPPSLKRRLKEYLKAQVYKSDHNTVAKGLLYKVNQADNTYTFSGIGLKHIPSLLEKFGFHDNVLWSYNPLLTDYFDIIPHTYAVFDAVDNWSTHSVYSLSVQQRIAENYHLIEAKTDAIFTVAESLLHLFPHHKHISWIPNGVDTRHFQDVSVVPEDIKNIPKPIIGYHGIIQDRLDVELIFSIAKQQPLWSFVFIGPVWPHSGVEILQTLPNVYFLGRKGYSVLPNYLHQFDLGFIPHKISKLTQTMNPLKIYEYLACGKPIVSTPIAGIEPFRDWILVGDNASGCIHHIENALKNDSQALQVSRKKIIQKHSWDQRVQTMMNFIC